MEKDASTIAPHPENTIPMFRQQHRTGAERREWMGIGVAGVIINAIYKVLFLPGVNPLPTENRDLVNTAMALSFGSALSESSFTGVLMITGQVGDISHGYRVPCQTPVCLCAPTDQLLRWVETVSMSTSWSLNVRQLPGSAVLQIEHMGYFPAWLGGMGVGAEFLGGKVGVSVDFNALSTEHLTTNSR